MTETKLIDYSKTLVGNMYVETWYNQKCRFNRNSMISTQMQYFSFTLADH